MPETTASKQGRFKPGQSGNPAGRPRGARHATTIAIEALLDGEAETITRKAIEAAGTIDALVNNAGISRRSNINDDSAPEAWDQLIEVNLQGLFNVTHAFVPALKRTREIGRAHV